MSLKNASDRLQWRSGREADLQLTPVSNRSTRSMEMPRQLGKASESAKKPSVASMPILFSPRTGIHASSEPVGNTVLELTLDAPNNEMPRMASVLTKSRSVQLDTTQPSGPQPNGRQLSIVVPQTKKSDSARPELTERIKETEPISLSGQPTVVSVLSSSESGALRSMKKPLTLKAVDDELPGRPAGKIRQVQGLQDLKLPFGNAADGDLAPPQAGTKSGLSAPSPEDIFSESFPLKFREGEAAANAAAEVSGKNEVVETIQETIQPGNVDLFNLVPEEKQSTATAAEGAIEGTDSSSVFEVFSVTDPSNEADDAEGNVEAATETAAATLQNGDGDIRSAIQKQLERMEKLPPVPGAADDAEDLPSPSDEDNPLSLFGDGDETSDDKTDEDKERAKRDLAETNGLDCESGACGEDYAQLKRRERTDLSLNITPTIEPTEENMAKVEEARVEKLAKAPSRTWTDRAGNVIADGKLEDYRYEKVYVRTMNGTIRMISHHKLSDADRCFVAGWWELPPECHFEDEQYRMRDFRMTTFTWVAAATCHKPLYFEQPAVERYGHSAGPIAQPIISGAHFFGDIVMLPYHAGITPPDECVYPLGHYRPGDCAPWLVPGFPFSTRAFKWEGMALGAAIALLP